MNYYDTFFSSSLINVYICTCLDAVPGPAEAQEPGAPDLVRTSAWLGGRQHEEPGSRGLHVPGPCEKWVQ